MSRSEIFRGEEDIDKGKVIFTHHAIARFLEHCQNNKLPIPTKERAEEALRKIFLEATNKNAIGPVERVRCLIDYGESYFFRNGRWQFRIQRKSLNKFIVITVVYLNERVYRYCFKK